MNKIKSNKKLIVIIASLLIVSLIILFYFVNPSYKTNQALKDTDCLEAVQQYSKIDSSIEKKLFSMLLPSTLEDLNERYNNGYASLEDVAEVYDTVHSFDSSVDISSYYNSFKELSSSKQAYDKASYSMENSDYISAISNYKKVIGADSMYDTAQQELQDAIKCYKEYVYEKFYEYVLRKDNDNAAKIINEALSVIDDPELEQKKERLSSNLYKKIRTLIQKHNDWETITESHAGENSYCCYRIEAYNSRVFKCYYVAKSVNSLVQSGNVSSIGGPVASYRIKGDSIYKLNYNEEKSVESNGSSGSVSWDYTMSKVEKFKKFEQLLA